MHIYTIHEHVDTPPGERDPHAVFVREGFSLFALIFSILWFLFHRMWREAILIAMVIAMIFLVVQGGDIVDFTGTALRGVFGLAVALFAHDMQRAALARKGFREVGVASGGNAEEAALEYMLRPDVPVAVPVAASVAASVATDESKEIISEQ